MTKKRRYIISMCAAILSAGAAENAFASGIVQCGRDGNMCKLCDLIVGINTIIKYGFSIAVVVALTIIVVGAIMYIVSAGQSGMMETAKGAMKNAAIGIIIVLTAWLIVNYTMVVLQTKSDLGIQATSGWSSFTCAN